jgi:hypothetical protein
MVKILKMISHSVKPIEKSPNRTRRSCFFYDDKEGNEFDVPGFLDLFQVAM